MLQQIRKTLNSHPSLWLPIGAALVVLSQNRFGLGFLVWVMPVPYMLFLRRTSGWRTRAGFVAVMVGAWSLAVMKILTDPMPLVIAPLFGLPIALFHALPYLAWDAIRRRVGEGTLAAASFAALVTTGEWAMHTFTEFATWGAAAYTQLDNLPLLQVASLGGMAAVAFTIYLFAAAIENAVANGFSKGKTGLALGASLLLAAMVFGTVRLDRSAEAEERTALVAAVVSDMVIKPDTGLPDSTERHRVKETLIARTETAAAGGVRLVAWNEGGYIVEKDEEEGFIKEMGSLARRLRIHLVAAYIIPLSRDPVTFENKYAWLRPDGSLHHDYHKLHPVPGEPAVGSSVPAKTVNSDLGIMSGALCYDYDFPALARHHARKGVDLVVIPSNDWRGIDPIHTRMAFLRGIEGGFSILRSTGPGLSAAADAYGRVRAWQSSFDHTDKVMFARLPQRGTQTVYAVLGDWVIVLCGLIVAAAVAAVLRRRSR